MKAHACMHACRVAASMHNPKGAKASYQQGPAPWSSESELCGSVLFAPYQIHSHQLSAALSRWTCQKICCARDAMPWTRDTGPGRGARTWCRSAMASARNEKSDALKLCCAKHCCLSQTVLCVNCCRPLKQHPEHLLSELRKTATQTGRHM